MLKDATYKEKFIVLAPWMPAIMDVVKRDLKNEHLKKDVAFVRHYFAGKNMNKLNVEELAQAYSHHMANAADVEELGEYLANRWLLKNTELYQYFEQTLSKINPEFQEIEMLDSNTSHAIMEEAITQFGALPTYLFCVMNSVVFPDEIYTKLAQHAEKAKHQSAEEAQKRNEHESMETMQRNYELQIARLTDKYEKKLSGLQKKYTTDIDTLKKQVGNLQRKLHVNA